MSFRISGFVMLALALAAAAADGAAPQDPHDPHSPDAQHGDNGDPHKEDGSHHAINPNPLTIDPDLGIFTFVVFFVLFAVLSKFAWGPILAGLELREKGIASQCASAEASNKKAHQLLQQYEQQLQQASEEVRAILDKAKREAESMKQTIVDDARAAAAGETEQAAAEIQAAKTDALSQLAGQSVDMAFRVASSAVKREVRPADHHDLIQQSLS